MDLAKLDVPLQEEPPPVEEDSFGMFRGPGWTELVLVARLAVLFARW